jgi:membrane-associated phospholipid phosphatase
VTYRAFLSRRYVRIGIAGLALFALMAVLVHLRLLGGIDLAVMRLKQPLGGPFLDALAELSALAISAEFSVVYAAIATGLLSRAGVGRWSIAPFGFVALEPVELGLKLIVHQPTPPSEFYRQIYYPLTGVVLSGSFPSGHAMRSAFFFVFLAALVGVSGSPLAVVGTRGLRIGQALCVLLALLISFSRIYLGYHWPSDVLAGFILGGSAALLYAGPVTERLRPKESLVAVAQEAIGTRRTGNAGRPAGPGTKAI